MTPGADAGARAGTRLGGYYLISLLGSGGMAEVYRARDLELDRHVAVKVLSEQLADAPGYAERFRHEARLVAALSHPNIVPIYNFGEDGGLLYIVMPVLAGSLRDRIVRAGALAPEEAARLAREVAAGLGAAHAHGLVHRDVKPGNILLDDQGRALLADFGIAREEAVLRDSGSPPTLAGSGLPVGTPQYMAPEQLQGTVADHRVDVYALGAVLYEMLTGRPAYVADSVYHVIARVIAGRIEPPSARRPGIWPALDAMVLRAMALDPEARYPDMRNFAAALDEAMVRRDAPATPAWRGSDTLTALPPRGRPSPSAAMGGVDAATVYAGRPPSGGRRRPRRSGGRLALASIGALLVAVVLSGLLLFALDGKKLVTAGGSPIGRASPTAAIPPTAVGTPAGTPVASPTAGQAPTDAPTATAGPTDTPAPGGTPSPTVAATATPTVAGPAPSVDVAPATVYPCPSKPAAFTITYTAGPVATTWEADSPSPGDILLSLNQDGSGASADVTGTFQPGDAVTVYVGAQRLIFGPGQIPISAGGISGIATVNYGSCGIVGPLARPFRPSA